MTAVRRWIVKVLTGLAAVLLAGLQALGNAHIPPYAHPYSYTWTDHGMRIVWEEEMARLEGELHEDQIRATAERGSRERTDANGPKAAS